VLRDRINQIFSGDCDVIIRARNPFATLRLRGLIYSLEMFFGSQECGMKKKVLNFTKWAFKKTGGEKFHLLITLLLSSVL
jgi:hypothetical protein